MVTISVVTMFVGLFFMRKGLFEYSTAAQTEETERKILNSVDLIDMFMVVIACTAIAGKCLFGSRDEPIQPLRRLNV